MVLLYWCKIIAWGLVCGKTFTLNTYITGVVNYRPTWKLNNLEPVAGNYYPVTSRLLVEADDNFKAAILNDRAQVSTLSFLICLIFVFLNAVSGNIHVPFVFLSHVSVKLLLKRYLV